MAYAEYQPRSSSQQPRSSRYYYSDADDDSRAPRSATPRYTGDYSDRGREANRRSWNPRQDQLTIPRYNPADYAYSVSAGPSTLSPYYTADRARRHTSRARDADERSVRSYGEERSRSRRPADDRDARSRSRAASHRDRSADRGSTMDKAKDQAREAYDQTREVLDKAFDTRGKGVAAGVVGALLGGAVGKRLGDRDEGHALAGALIGGLGLNMLENQIHRRKEAQREEEAMIEEQAEYRRTRRGRER